MSFILHNIAVTKLSEVSCIEKSGGHTFVSYVCLFLAEMFPVGQCGKIIKKPYFCVSIVFGEILHHYSTQMNSQKKSVLL